MTNVYVPRGLFNELATLLGRLDGGALERLTTQYPEFADEVRRGPDAGDGEADLDYHRSRAKFTSEICRELIESINVRADKLMERAASLNSSKLALALIAGLGGAGTLGAFGVGQEEIVRIGAIVTSIVALLNAVLETFAKRYTAVETQKAIELKNAALSLSQLRSDMDLAAQWGRPAVDIATLVEKCNQIALDLNRRKDQLRLV